MNNLVSLRARFHLLRTTLRNISSGTPISPTSQLLTSLRPRQQSRLFSYRPWTRSIRSRLHHSSRSTSRNYSSHPKPSEPSPNPTPHLNSPEPRSLSARLKKLSREYGWSALGVYLGLSALDFPFCFLAVRWLGTERIGYAEHVIVNGFWRAVEVVVPDARSRVAAMRASVKSDQAGHAEGGGVVATAVEDAAEREGAGWGVEAAQEQNKGDNASIWTQLALAYAIHKSFIFVRVPLTAAVTPKVVKTLRGWGWNIGKRTPKTPNP